MKVTTKRRLLVLGIILGSFVVMSFLASMKPPQPKRPSIDNALLVETLTLAPESVQFQVSSQGTVMPRIYSTFSAEISGQIVYISDNFVAGGLFMPNEVLMEIDPTDYEVDVAQAKALVKQRQIEYEGARTLRKQGYRAEAELASAEAALAAAKSALVRAENNLDSTKIRLPYKGMVREKIADLGQYVNPGSRLAVAFAIETAEVRLPLTDKDLAYLELPMSQLQTDEVALPKVTLSAVQRGKRVNWDANIIRTEGVVDETSRVTFAVAEVIDPYKTNQTLVADNEPPLPMGTYVSARIDGVAMDNVIKVPRGVLRGQNELLFISDENKLQIEAVNILKTDDNYAYIDDLSIVDRRISLTAIGSPINGMRVRTSDDPPVTPSETESQEVVAGKQE